MTGIALIPVMQTAFSANWCEFGFSLSEVSPVETNKGLLPDTKCDKADSLSVITGSIFVTYRQHIILFEEVYFK